MKCPKCGNEIEFYTKHRISGISVCRFRTDGEDAENGDMYEGLDVRFASKFVFCEDCNAKVCKIEDCEFL